MRSFFPSETDAKKIMNRAVQLRNGKMPASDTSDEPRIDILIDVVMVWPTGRSGVRWQRLAALLAESRPEAYGDVTADLVSALLRSLESRTRTSSTRDAT